MVAMANVPTSLYWQLTENYIYTLLKFDMSDCGVMICVNDDGCMDRCRAAAFPCYNFKYMTHHAQLPEVVALGASAGARTGSMSSIPSVLEMIAYLKLFHIPRALSRGVELLAVLDLDVGFLGSPQSIFNYMYNTKPLVAKHTSRPEQLVPGRHDLTYDYTQYNQLDALVQQDVTFIMNRSEAGWKQWWTEPMPNIGLLVLKNTPAVQSTFRHAWRDYYQNTRNEIRKHPGKDQNKVVAALQHIGGRLGTGFGSDTAAFNAPEGNSPQHSSHQRLQWRYVPVTQAVLIDKLFKFVNQAVELGGEATAAILAGRTPESSSETESVSDLSRNDKTKGVANMKFMHQNTWLSEQEQEQQQFVGAAPPAAAVHVTCFEKDTKMMGLKAANAFWNPLYYDPRRPTITKKLLLFNRNKNAGITTATTTVNNGKRDLARTGRIGRFFELNEDQLQDEHYTDTNTLTQEVHALVYLALALNRSLIIPNILIETAKGALEKILYRVDPQKSNVIQRPKYHNNTVWPGFRVLYLPSDDKGEPLLPLQQVEPAYYWRVQRDYDIPNISKGKESGTIVPDPVIVSFVHDVSLEFIEETLQSFSNEEMPRLVIHMLPHSGQWEHDQQVYVSRTMDTLSASRTPTSTEAFVIAEQAKQKKWTQHSVGHFDPWTDESQRYWVLPSTDRIREQERDMLLKSSHTTNERRKDHRIMPRISATDVSSFLI